MADLRLIAAVAAGVAATLVTGAALSASACGRAGAAPDETSGLTPPAGWQALPPIAAAAKAALGRGAEVGGAEAWGEPAMGCYAVWLAIRAAGSAEAIGAQVAAGFTAAAGSGSGERLTVKDVVAPQGDQGDQGQGQGLGQGLLTLAFERGEHRGRLRARLGGGRIAALACFANPREPLACEAACTAFLGGMP